MNQLSESFRIQLDSRERNLSIASRKNAKNVKIWIGTFNVNARTAIQDQMEGFIDAANTNADVYILGLQEIVNLNVINVSILPNHASGPWENDIADALHSASKNRYVLLFTCQLVGLLLIGYVKEELFPYCHHLEEDKVACGILGVGGNKGGIGVRFNLYDTSFCFVTSHLSAHQEKIKERNDDYVKISNKLSFPVDPETQRYPKQTRLTIFDHDFLFWFGDLNYRINDESPGFNDIFEHVSNNDTEWLLERDQLTIERREGRTFHNWCEGEISFLPTYKYQPGTMLYDIRPNKKLRGPAWCDRILYYIHPSRDSMNDETFLSFKNPLLGLNIPNLSMDDNAAVKKTVYDIVDVDNPSGFEQMFYTSHISTISDHQPVSSLFQCTAIINPARFATESQGSIWDYIDVSHFFILETQLSIGAYVYTNSELDNYLFEILAVSAGAVDNVFKSGIDYVRSLMGATLSDITPSFVLDSGVARFATASNVHPNNLFIITVLSCLFVTALFFAVLVLYYIILGILYNFVSYFRTETALLYPVYRLRGLILKLLLLFMYCLTVTALYQFTLTDHWLLYLLAAIIIGPLTVGVMFIPAYYLQDRAEYYNVYKNLVNRWIYGVWCSEYTKDNRLWTIARCSYLLIMAVLIAFLRDHQKWGQVIGVLLIQITYYIALWIRRPYHDPAVMWLQLLMHTIRVITLLLALAFLLINDSISFSGAQLQTCRYGLHGFVLFIWLLVRIQKLSRDVLIFLFPNFCKCLQYDGWDELVVSNSNHDSSFEESAGSNKIKGRGSLHFQTNASKKLRVSNPIDLDQTSIVPVGSIPLFSNSKEPLSKPLQTTLSKAPVSPKLTIYDKLSTPLAPKRSSQHSPSNPSIEMPDLSNLSNSNFTLPPPPPAIDEKKESVPSSIKSTQPVLSRAISRNDVLFGKIKLRSINNGSEQNSTARKLNTINSVPDFPKRDASLIIEDDQDDSGDDEDEKSREMKAKQFKNNLNFFQKLNQGGIIKIITYK